jgi:hypothetical protein
MNKICKNHGEIFDENITKNRRCKLCQREQGLRCYRKHAELYRERQKEQFYIKKEYRRKNPDKTKKWRKISNDKSCKNMTNSYIREILVKNGFNRNQISQDLIDIKRVILTIHRLKGK